MVKEYIVLLDFLISGSPKEMTVTHSYLKVILQHNPEESGFHSYRSFKKPYHDRLLAEYQLDNSSPLFPSLTRPCLD